MAIFTIDGYDSYSGCDIVVTASLPSINDNSVSTYFTLGSLQTLSVSTHQDKRPVRSIGNINPKDYVMGQRTIAGSLVFAVFDRHFADKILKQLSITMADEIPALNLTINFANEYGRSSRMAIYGVKLINEGQVMSINDLYTENTYQFVALGMEPLTADESAESVSMKKRKLPSQISTNSDLIKEVVESVDFNKNSGKVISDIIKNNSDFTNKEGIVLTSQIEQPIDSTELGLVTLELSPIQHEGSIYITDLVSNKIAKTIIVDSSKIYTVELPVGYYNARYIDSTRTRESNIEKLIIKIQSIKNKKTNNNIYPIVEYVTSSSIAVTMYGNIYDKVVCFASGDEEKELINNGKILVFKNLKPNTQYNIYGVNNNQESNMITITTYEDKNTYYNKFKYFIESNKHMLKNDYLTITETLKSLLTKENNQEIWQYDNILDGVITLPNSLLKQELLLYAMIFENSILESYNNSNPYKINIVQNDLFDSSISINNWEIIKCYSKLNNKLILEQVSSSSNPINIVPNKQYGLYGINNDTCSIKKNIISFSSDAKEFLDKYKNINKYKELDIAYYKDMYQSLSLEELYSLAIRDNHLCDILLLEEPRLFMKDNYIYADIQYDDKMLLDDMYYLCVSNMYETLNDIPHRKESFNKNTKELNLTINNIPFNFDSIYHAWVEDKNGRKISKTTIFNNKGAIGLDKVLDGEYMSILNNKERLLINEIADNSLVENVIDNIYSESIPIKDIDSSIEYKLIDLGIKSYNSYNILDDVLYKAILVNSSNRLETSKCGEILLDKNNKKIQFISNDILDMKIITKSYDLDNENITCNIYNTNNLINVNGDYMVVYIINVGTDKISGLMVIDCNTYKYKSLSIDIKEGE